MSNKTAASEAAVKARQIAAEYFYGNGTKNLGCNSAACKNCQYGSKDWQCSLCDLQQAIIAALDSFARVEVLRAKNSCLMDCRHKLGELSTGEWFEWADECTIDLEAEEGANGK